jgi:BirA family biotin operon repressor/biotin-[acetyl-CoA-carboxylase] ligase
MDESALESRLGVPVTSFDVTPDTSGYLRREIPDAPHGRFAVANELTAARGRSGEAWAAPPGGVWSSTLLYPDLDPSQVGRLTIAGGVAAAEAARSFGVDARLTWPNDVVVPDTDERRKLAGVLTEAVVDAVPVVGKPVADALDDPDELEAVVMGIGVNADLDPDALETDRAVTTLRAETGGEVDREAVAARLHERLLERAGDVETADGFAALLDDWRELAVTVGEPVRVSVGTRVIEGTAEDVTDAGALVVRTENGREIVREGDCDRLRRS